MHARGKSRAVAAIACVAGALVASTADAAPPIVKRHVKVVQLAPARTTTVYLAYPDALKLGGTTYSSSIRIESPASGGSGRQPNLRLVKVLSDGPWEGGSLLRVRISNRNPRGTKPLRAVIVAIAREPGPAR